MSLFFWPPQAYVQQKFPSTGEEFIGAQKPQGWSTALRYATIKSCDVVTARTRNTADLVDDPFLAHDQLLAAGRRPMPTSMNRRRVGVNCGAVAHIDECSAHEICAFQLGDNGPTAQQFGHSITASRSVCVLTQAQFTQPIHHDSNSTYIHAALFGETITPRRSGA